MKDVHLYAIAAGLLFGVWPLLMNRSGLDGFASAALFALIAFLIIVPVAFWSGQMQHITPTSAFTFVIAAGVCGGLGLLFFNTMLAKVSQKDVGMMFMIVLMFQLAAPAIYHVFQNGDYSPRKIVGIAGAFLVAYMLA